MKLILKGIHGAKWPDVVFASAKLCNGGSQ